MGDYTGAATQRWVAVLFFCRRKPLWHKDLGRAGGRNFVLSSIAARGYVNLVKESRKPSVGKGLG